MRFWVVVLAGLLLGCQKNQTSAGPGFQEPGALVGSYQVVPTLTEPGSRIYALDLRQDGSALLTVETVGVGDPVLDKGRWTSDGMDVTVELSKAKFVWTRLGKELRPKVWDKDAYGEKGLVLTKRL